MEQDDRKNCNGAKAVNVGAVPPGVRGGGLETLEQQELRRRRDATTLPKEGASLQVKYLRLGKYPRIILVDSNSLTCETEFADRRSPDGLWRIGIKQGSIHKWQRLSELISARPIAASP